MKKLRYYTLLIVNLGLPLIAFSQPTTSDSLICLNSAEAKFFILQSFDILEQKNTLVLKQRTINILQNENVLLRGTINQKDEIIKLCDIQALHYKSDIVVLEKEIHSLSKRKHLLKLGFITFGIAAGVELLFIGVLAR